MKIGVIADDLTGANATGVRLTKEGFPAVTVVHSSPFPKDQGYDAVIMDTDSRYLPTENAAERVKTAAEELNHWGAELISKRIDSTVRGNIGPELDQLLELFPDRVAVVTPSFPASDRVVIGGYMLVDDVPLQKTDVANDPVKPLTTSCVPELIEEQSTHTVHSIGLKDIMASNGHLQKVLRDAFQSGARIIVCDAVTDEDVERIAATLKEIPEQDIITVDPGPFTAAYASACAEEMKQGGRILATVGSATALTGKQLERLIEDVDPTVVYAKPEQLASYTASWEEEVQRVTEEALKRLAEREVLVITTHRQGMELINLKAKAQEEGVTEEALAKRMTDGLGSITRQVIERGKPEIRACYSSGGDVTASLCAFSRANGIALEDEVIPLASYGRLVGGYFDRLPIVTKGGMVGDKRSMLEAVKFLRTKL
ncbi:four-carbon acid sugar kinase family protein [Salsuginibacillus kocurii]|uniref:four-carbon acid sugar kinase family protein n=1 Tax=Salsuginibacillus kocurii TaxID=427078 RepID=UPI0003811868|nr:four-carbon acid sugar kinase family protein [Salsuginibacillus kocurii]